MAPGFKIRQMGDYYQIGPTDFPDDWVDELLTKRGVLKEVKWFLKKSSPAPIFPIPVNLILKSAILGAIIFIFARAYIRTS